MCVCVLIHTFTQHGCCATHVNVVGSSYLALLTHVGGGHAGYSTPVDNPPYRPTDLKADVPDSK